MESETRIIFRSRGAYLVIAGLLLVSVPGSTQEEGRDPYQPRISPESVTQLQAARSLRRQQDYDRAIEAFEDLVRAEPDYYRAHYNLGLAYADSGEYEKAIEALEEALTIRNEERLPEYTIFNSIGWVHLLKGDYSAAERHFQAGLDQVERLDDDSHLRVLNNLGLLYLYSGRYQEAQETLESAVEEFGSETASRSLELLQAVRKQAEDQPPQ